MMEHSYHLAYKEISLVPMDLESSESYRKIRNCGENRKWFLHTEEISEEEQREWFIKYLSLEGDYMFSVVDSDSIFIGGCAIYNIDKKLNTGEFGRIVIDEKRKGNGYGYLVSMAAVKIAKEKIGLKKLFLTVKKDNIPAQKIYSKIGFKYEDTEGGKQYLNDIDMRKMVLLL